MTTTGGKAIMIPRPVVRDTVYCQIPEDADHAAIVRSVHAAVERVREHMPGYTLRAEPQFGLGGVSVFLEAQTSEGTIT